MSRMHWEHGCLATLIVGLGFCVSVFWVFFFVVFVCVVFLVGFLFGCFYKFCCLETQVFNPHSPCIALCAIFSELHLWL